MFDTAGDFGSAGRLQSIVMMDRLSKYPEDPQTQALGEFSTLGLLGHESGHRWLALLQFVDHNGRVSDDLLGRDLVHWSFFFDSDASFMEGNNIQDLGGGSFRTAGASRPVQPARPVRDGPQTRIRGAAGLLCGGANQRATRLASPTRRRRLM